MVYNNIVDALKVENAKSVDIECWIIMFLSQLGSDCLIPQIIMDAIGIVCHLGKLAFF